jgi:hypothetical protein
MAARFSLKGFWHAQIPATQKRTQNRFLQKTPRLYLNTTTFPIQKVNIMAPSRIVPTFKGSSIIVLAYPNLPLFVDPGLIAARAKPCTSVIIYGRQEGCKLFGVFWYQPLLGSA